MSATPETTGYTLWEELRDRGPFVRNDVLDRLWVVRNEKGDYVDRYEDKWQNDDDNNDEISNKNNDEDEYDDVNENNNNSKD